MDDDQPSDNDTDSKYRIVFSWNDQVASEAVGFLDLRLVQARLWHLQALNQYLESEDVPNDLTELFIRSATDSSGLNIKFRHDYDLQKPHIDVNLDWSGQLDQSVRWSASSDTDLTDIQGPGQWGENSAESATFYPYTYQGYDPRLLTLNSIDVFYNRDAEWNQSEFIQWYQDIRQAYEYSSFWRTREMPVVRFHPIGPNDVHVLDLGNIETDDHIRSLIAMGPGASPGSAQFHLMEDITPEALANLLRTSNFSDVTGVGGFSLQNMPRFQQTVRQDATAIILVDATPVSPMSARLELAAADPILSGALIALATHFLSSKLLRRLFRKARKD